jgi:hypothetical protein
MNARESLATFMREHALEPDRVEEFTCAIEDAFKRAQKPFPTRKDLAQRAEALASAAGAFAAALGHMVDVGDEQALAVRELRFFLRISETLSAGPDLTTPEGAQAALEEGRRFDRDAAFLFQHLDELKRACLAIEVAATRVRPVLARRGKPIDERRRSLGLELAGLWFCLTGQRPGASGKAEFDSPGGPFGKFVERATLAYNFPLTPGEFQGFLRDAVDDFKSSWML